MHCFVHQVMDVISFLLSFLGRLRRCVLTAPLLDGELSEALVWRLSLWWECFIQVMVPFSCAIAVRSLLISCHFSHNVCSFQYCVVDASVCE